MYIGVNGIARKVKAVYIGVNGVARKVKAIYIGVNGVARKVVLDKFYNWLFQYGVHGGSNYGVIDSCTNTWVDDHYELYMKTTRTSNSASYPSFDEIKITSDETLVGKTISITYTYVCSGIGKVNIQAFDSSNSYIGGSVLNKSTTKITSSYTISHTSTAWICVTNGITGSGTSDATLCIYSIKIDDKEIL